MGERMAEEISKEAWAALEFMRPEDRAEYVFKIALEKAPGLVREKSRTPHSPNSNALHDFIFKVGERLGLVVTKIQENAAIGPTPAHEVEITVVNGKNGQNEHTMRFTIDDHAEVTLREHFKVQTRDPMEFLGLEKMKYVPGRK
jgi:hypothetical protein